jgi:hypothetical protein
MNCTNKRQKAETALCVWVDADLETRGKLEVRNTLADLAELLANLGGFEGNAPVNQNMPPQFMLTVSLCKIPQPYVTIRNLRLNLFHCSPITSLHK